MSRAGAGGIVAPGVTLCVVLAGYTVLSRVLASSDVVSALTARHWATAVLAGGVLLLRLFLYLVAPGWALHVVVRALLGDRARRDDVTSDG